LWVVGHVDHSSWQIWKNCNSDSSQMLLPWGQKKYPENNNIAGGVSGGPHNWMYVAICE